MSIKEIYLLPKSILYDVAMLMEFEDLDEKDIMKYIKRYYKGDIKFNIKELRKYLDGLKESRKSDILIPAKVEVPSKQDNSMVNNFTNMPQNVVDYKNKAAVMEWLRKIGVERITAVVNEQTRNPQRIIAEMDALLLNQQKVLADIIEKEDKMKLTMMESNQHKQFLKEELSKLLIIIRGVLKKRLPEKKYREIADDLTEVLSLYKIKV